jgi:hypothetical protein
MAGRKFSPTFEGIGILMLALVVLWFSWGYMPRPSLEFTVALGLSVLGILAAIGDFIGMYDMSEFVDFEQSQR